MGFSGEKRIVQKKKRNYAIIIIYHWLFFLIVNCKKWILKLFMTVSLDSLQLEKY